MMKYPPFKDYFFAYFQKWEQSQPGKRSTFSAFGRWLSDNRYGVEIKQQLVSYWIKGPYEPTEEKYILVLAEKLGDEIYDVLHIKRPDPFILYIRNASTRMNEGQKKRIAEQVAKYIKENETQSEQ